MKSKGIRRILALSTPSYYAHPETVSEISGLITQSRLIFQQRSFFMSAWLLMPPLFVPQANAEMIAIAEAVAAEEDLDWTIFRVPHLNEGNADFPVWAGLLGPDYKGSLELSRASQARWLLNEIDERAWIRAAPALGNCWRVKENIYPTSLFIDRCFSVKIDPLFDFRGLKTKTSLQRYYSRSKSGTKMVKDKGVLHVIIMAHAVMVSYVLQ